MDLAGPRRARSNSPRDRENPAHGPFPQVVAGVGFEPAAIPNGRSHGQARTASPTPLDLAQKGQASHGEAGPMEVVTCCVVRKRTRHGAGSVRICGPGTSGNAAAVSTPNAKPRRVRQRGRRSQGRATWRSGGSGVRFGAHYRGWTERPLKAWWGQPNRGSGWCHAGHRWSRVTSMER